MGMSMSAYWLSSWMYFAGLSLVQFSILSIISSACLVDFFIAVNPMSWILLLLIYALTQPVTAMFVSNMFSRPKIAIMVTYFLVLLVYIATPFLNLFGGFLSLYIFFGWKDVIFCSINSTDSLQFGTLPGDHGIWCGFLPLLSVEAYMW